MKFAHDMQSGLYLPNYYRRPSPFDKVHLQWFAENPGLFLADGEDIADVSPWELTAISNEGGNVFSLQAAAKCHGSYGYMVDFDGTNEYAYGYKTLDTPATTLYGRTYIYISAGFDLNHTWDTLGLFAFSINGTFKINISLRSEGTEFPTKWRVSGGGLTSTDSGTNYTLGAWHYIDMYWKAESEAEAGNGAAQVWVDGDSIYSETDRSTGAGALTRIYVGSNGGSVPNAVDYLYYDDIKVAATGPIGAYAEGGSVVPLLLNQNGRRRRMI